ncbi:hypothetical protein E2986_13708 [Frieseomelitta varia]|uniref:Uncharacterized protein n=1 Tax=Frieseomelitta varia TaxID=561572 RepID=A0A833VU28_9HYME|nr:hypothetical protein E2986_13708 [Frieseomelitta varia]
MNKTIFFEERLSIGSVNVYYTLRSKDNNLDQIKLTILACLTKRTQRITNNEKIKCNRINRSDILFLSVPPKSSSSGRKKLQMQERGIEKIIKFERQKKFESKCNYSNLLNY